MNFGIFYMFTFILSVYKLSKALIIVVCKDSYVFNTCGLD